MMVIEDDNKDKLFLEIKIKRLYNIYIPLFIQNAVWLS
jgi:hypothetical protein